jgi:hypothetical protein
VTLDYQGPRSPKKSKEIWLFNIMWRYIEITEWSKWQDTCIMVSIFCHEWPATFIPLDRQNAFHYGSWSTPLRREWQQIIAAQVLARQTREVFTVLFLYIIYICIYNIYIYVYIYTYIYIYVYIYYYYLVLSYLISNYVVVLVYHIILHNIIYISCYILLYDMIW